MQQSPACPLVKGLKPSLRAQLDATGIFGKLQA
jgi:hypothetical protein